MRTIDLGYRPRPHQDALHAGKKRFSVAVWHRRGGKTVMAVMELIHAALHEKKKQGRYAYVGPTLKQTKAVAWDYLKLYAGRVPGVKFRETELSCEFGNGSRIRLWGAENPDALRGLYLDGVVVDETALMPKRLYSEILLPALTDRRGWVIFIGTPQGHNVFYELFRRAQNDPSWFTSICRASETGVISPKDLDEARSQMTPEEFEQEFECSFEAAVPGAYFAREMAAAEREGRITSLGCENLLPVHTAWDLGVADSTAVWFFQVPGRGRVHLVDYLEASGEGLPHYAAALRQKSYSYGVHIAPHDIMVRDLSTGKSRLETARSLGIPFTVAPRLPLADGINAARLLLPRAWFDSEKCGPGIEALKLFRQVKDERTGQFTGRPLHDWTSHAADAFRYLALGLDLAAPGCAPMTAAQAAALYEQFAPPRIF